MKTVIALAFASLMSANLRAASFCADTTQPKQLYKISHQQFLDKYGKDDTSRAVIDYFFSYRRKAPTRIIISSVALGAGIALTGVAAISTSILGVAFITIPLMAVSAAFLLSNCTDLLKFSRKKLLKILDNYFDGKGMPMKLKKQMYRK